MYINNVIAWIGYGPNGEERKVSRSISQAMYHNTWRKMALPTPEIPWMTLARKLNTANTTRTNSEAVAISLFLQHYNSIEKLKLETYVFTNL